MLSKTTTTFEKDKDGKGIKKITHPSGVVSKYDAAHSQRQKDALLARKAEIDKQLAAVEKDLLDIEAVEDRT